jgi:dephospho-CoA kinase
MVEKTLVVGVAGRIGSGKTEVARILEGLGFQYFRYSLVLSEWFAMDPAAKKSLQRVGWKVMSGHRQRALNQRLIQQVDRRRDCVIDGLRHIIDYESLTTTFTPDFFLIYVEAAEDVRFQRLRDRFGTLEEFLTADRHPVESRIESLKSCASAVIDAHVTTQQLATKVEGIVAEFRSKQKMPSS